MIVLHRILFGHLNNFSFEEFFFFKYKMAVFHLILFPIILSYIDIISL